MRAGYTGLVGVRTETGDALMTCRPFQSAAVPVRSRVTAAIGPGRKVHHTTTKTAII